MKTGKAPSMNLSELGNPRCRADIYDASNKLPIWYITYMMQGYQHCVLFIKL